MDSCQHVSTSFSDPSRDRHYGKKQKATDCQTNFQVLTEGIEIGAGWSKTGETSGKEYVSLSIAAPEFGPNKLYANLGRAAGSGKENIYAVIWYPSD